MGHAARVEEGAVRVTYKMPKGIKRFQYAPNHHYVELEDSDGNVLHLPAHGIMRHKCGGCAFEWWTSSNSCSFCPSCSSTDVEKEWGQLQVAFVPEGPSEFKSPEQLLEGDTGDLGEVTVPGPRILEEDEDPTDPKILQTTIPKDDESGDGGK